MQCWITMQCGNLCHIRAMLSGSELQGVSLARPRNRIQFGCDARTKLTVHGMLMLQLLRIFL